MRALFLRSRRPRNNEGQTTRRIPERDAAVERIVAQRLPNRLQKQTKRVIEKDPRHGVHLRPIRATKFSALFFHFATELSETQSVARYRISMFQS